MAKRAVTITFAVCLLAGAPGLAEPWVITRGLVHVRPGAGPFSGPVVDRVKRKTQVEVVGKGPQGRWLEVSGILVTTDGETKHAPFKSGPDAQEVSPGWVPKRAARPVDKIDRPTEVARLSVQDVSAMRMSVLATIKGFNRDVAGMVANQGLDPKVAEWIMRPKFTPEDYESFVQHRRVDQAAQELTVKGEEDALLDLDPDMHEQIGRLAVTEMAQELGYRVVTDIRVNRYTNLVAALVGQCSSRYDLLYRVVVVDSPSVNSYSRPGGYIAITTGLLALCEDEAELAGALAHEIAHIARDHGLKERGNVRREIGIDIFGLEDELEQQVKKHFGSDSRDFHTAGAKDLHQMLNFFRGVAFSKKRLLREEREADFYALVYLARSGYDPHGLARLVDRIGRMQGYDPDTTMAVHDSPRMRLQYIDSYLRHLSLQPRPNRAFKAGFQDELGQLRDACQQGIKPAAKQEPRPVSDKRMKPGPRPTDPFAELSRMFGEL